MSESLFAAQRLIEQCESVKSHAELSFQKGGWEMPVSSPSRPMDINQAEQTVAQSLSEIEQRIRQVNGENKLWSRGSKAEQLAVQHSRCVPRPFDSAFALAATIERVSS